MSFKRDGDNSSLLSNLKRQRVGDLLVSHIPEDEALLLKNGKYTCTVCHHKPIFDTLDVLALHRRGKKHLLCLSKKLENDKKYAEMKLRKERNVLSVMATSATSKSYQKTAYHPLLKAKPYSSCSGRKRKITLQKAPKSTSPSVATEKSGNKSVLESYVKGIQKKTAFNQAVAKAKLTIPTSKVTGMPTAQEEFVVSVKPKPLNENDKRKAEHYLNLRMSGWKKDWASGKWIKDEEAEFESDDEQPCD